MVYEIYTWRNDAKSKAANSIAVEAAKKHKGRKFTVAVGEWGTRTFLVFADSKDEAKSIALNMFDTSPGRCGSIDRNKIKVREVTNCKKYQ